MDVSPRHRHPAGFQRLAERFKHLPGELGQLVQEKHTIVRQTELTGMDCVMTAILQNWG